MNYKLFFWKDVFIILPTFIIETKDNTLTYSGGWCAWGFVIKITH